MAISKTSKAATPAQSTLSPEVFPVSHSAALGTAEARRMTAISGRRCLELYGRRLRDGSSVRTLVASLLGTEAWSSKECSLTWKPKVTKRGRLLFQLAPSVPRTGGTGYGLLLTPTVVQTEESPERMRERAERNGYDNGTRWGSLASQIRYGFLPTPRAADGYKGTRSPEGYRREKERWGKRNGEDLPTAVAFKNGTTGRRLQPGFALWMMGYPEDWLDLEAGEMPRSKGQAMRLSRKSSQRFSDL